MEYAVTRRKNLITEISLAAILCFPTVGPAQNTVDLDRLAALLVERLDVRSGEKIFLVGADR